MLGLIMIAGFISIEQNGQVDDRDPAMMAVSLGILAGCGFSLIGLVLAPLSDELREKNGLGKEVKGVIVLEVDPQSPAAEKGIKPGDVIVEVAQDAVNSVEDISKGIDKVKKAGRKAVLLRLEGGKGGGLRFVAIPVE